MKARYKEVGHNKTLPQQGHPASPSCPISTFVSPRYNEKPELPDTARQPPWPQGHVDDYIMLIICQPRHLVKSFAVIVEINEMKWKREKIEKKERKKNRRGVRRVFLHENVSSLPRSSALPKVTHSFISFFFFFLLHARRGYDILLCKNISVEKLKQKIKNSEAIVPEISP